MNSYLQNILSQTGSPVGLGRIIRRTEIWVAPYTKREFTLRHVEETYEKNGIFITEEYTQICPELDDGTTPDSVKQLRECPCCFRVVTQTYVCPKCNREVFRECTDEVGNDGQEKRLCKRCAAKAENPVLFEVRDFLWGD
jgi:hypothetical protein